MGLFFRHQKLKAKHQAKLKHQAKPKPKPLTKLKIKSKFKPKFKSKPKQLKSKVTQKKGSMFFPKRHKKKLGLVKPNLHLLHTSEKVLKILLDNRIYLGHKKQRWNPKMQPFLLDKSLTLCVGKKKKSYAHVLDPLKTLSHMNYLSVCFSKLVFKRQKLLFVGTKRQYKGLISKAANLCTGYFISEKWLGGLLTNWQTVRTLTDLLRKYDILIEQGVIAGMYKKEAARAYKEKNRLERLLEGVKYMSRKPDLVIVMGQLSEATVLDECKKIHLPSICLVDSNCSPQISNLVLPTNDDSIRSLNPLFEVVINSVLRGHLLLQPKDYNLASKDGSLVPTVYKSKAKTSKSKAKISKLKAKVSKSKAKSFKLKTKISKLKAKFPKRKINAAMAKLKAKAKSAKATANLRSNVKNTKLNLGNLLPSKVKLPKLNLQTSSKAENTKVQPKLYKIKEKARLFQLESNLQSKIKSTKLKPNFQSKVENTKLNLGILLPSKVNISKQTSFKRVYPLFSQPMKPRLNIETKKLMSKQKPKVIPAYQTRKLNKNDNKFNNEDNNTLKLSKNKTVKSIQSVQKGSSVLPNGLPEPELAENLTLTALPSDLSALPKKLPKQKLQIQGLGNSESPSENNEKPEAQKPSNDDFKSNK